MKQEELRLLEVYYIDLLKKIHSQEAIIKHELAKIRGQYR